MTLTFRNVSLMRRHKGEKKRENTAIGGRLWKMPRVGKAQWTKAGETNLGFETPSLGGVRNEDLSKPQRDICPAAQVREDCQRRQVPRGWEINAPQRRDSCFGFVTAETVPRRVPLQVLCVGARSVLGVCLLWGGAFPRSRDQSAVQKDSGNWARLLANLQEWNVTGTLSPHRVVPSGSGDCGSRFVILILIGHVHQTPSVCVFLLPLGHPELPLCQPASGGWNVRIAFLSRVPDQGACHLTQQGMLFIDLK